MGGLFHTMAPSFLDLPVTSALVFYSRPVSCIPGHSGPLTLLEVAVPFESKHQCRRHLLAFLLTRSATSSAEILFRPPALQHSHHHSPVFTPLLAQHHCPVSAPWTPPLPPLRSFVKPAPGQPSHTPLCLNPSNCEGRPQTWLTRWTLNSYLQTTVAAQHCPAGPAWDVSLEDSLVCQFPLPFWLLTAALTS